MNNIDVTTWNHFDFFYNDLTFTVYWLQKDFSAIYESKFGTLEYGLHIPYTYPKVYSEEMLKGQYCYSVGRAFQKSLDFLEKNPSFIESTLSQFKKLKKSHTEELEKLQEERREKRLLFKNNEITSSVWYDFCKRYNKIKEDYSHNEEDFLYSKAQHAGVNSEVTSVIKDFLMDRLYVSY